MKKANKALNKISMILVVVLVFLCGFNVAYAYFTATATVQGSLQFYDLDVQFAYDTGSTEPTKAGTGEFQIYPSTSDVLRGNAFTFQTSGGTAIASIGLISSTNSCEYYARAKVKAIKVEENSSGAFVASTSDSTDYGNYVDLTIDSDWIVKIDDYYYFKGNALQAASYVTLATGATLSTSAPAELSDGYLKITISFEAVQATVSAAKITFGLTDANITTLGWNDSTTSN